jgi:uncharacterized membrane protein
MPPATQSPKESESAHLLHQSVEQHFSGPLPPPEILEQYQSIDPNFPERIIAMAEQQAAHRQHLEKQAVEAQIRDDKSQRVETRIGQFLGFLIACACLTASVLVVVFQPTAAGATVGSIIGGGGIIGLAVCTIALIVGGGAPAPPPACAVARTGHRAQIPFGWSIKQRTRL